MDGTLREDSRRARRNIVHDESCAILCKKATLEGTVDREVELGRSRVCVRCVHTTRTEEANGHCHTIAYQSRHVLGRSRSGMSTSSAGHTRSGM